MPRAPSYIRLSVWSAFKGFIDFQLAPCNTPNRRTLVAQIGDSVGKKFGLYETPHLIQT